VFCEGLEFKRPATDGGSTAITSCQKLILGVKFTDGLEVVAKPASRQLAAA
jgi:hypothetical protein